MSDLRVLRGADCWWAINRDRVARLPLDAASDPDNSGRAVIGAAAQAVLDEAGFFRSPPNNTYAVTVLTATTCNLGCAYCFQNTALPAEGAFAPPRIKAAALDSDDVDAIVQFVSGQMSAHGLGTLSLLLFGGEPLLNTPGCLRLLAALSRFGHVDAEIVTNGVLLTGARADAMYGVGLRRIQITFDGSRETHDSIRVTRNGGATYDRILGNITAAAAALPDLSWNLRVNVSHRNADGLDSLIDDLTILPRLARRVALHLALIDDTGLGYENDIGYDRELAERFVELNRAAIAAGMVVPPTRPLSDCPYCSVVGGGRGSVINADGQLYSCWENAGRDEWAVGDVVHGYLDDATVSQRWVACDFEIKSHGTTEATKAFKDRVTAAALDDQYRYRRLQGQVVAAGIG